MKNSKFEKGLVTFINKPRVFFLIKEWTLVKKYFFLLKNIDNFTQKSKLYKETANFLLKLLLFM